MDQMVSDSCATSPLLHRLHRAGDGVSCGREHASPQEKVPALSAAAAIGQTPSARTGQLASKRSRLNPCSKEAYLRKALNQEGELARCGLQYIGRTLLFSTALPTFSTVRLLSPLSYPATPHLSALQHSRCPPSACCFAAHPPYASPRHSCIKAPLRLQSHTSRRLARQSYFLKRICLVYHKPRHPVARDHRHF
jgi:hypothetical protein